MPKTRGESSTAAGKKRKTTISSFQAQGSQNFDHTWFTSRNNQRWYKKHKDNAFIKEKNLAPEVEAYFHVQDYFDKLGWSTMLNLPSFIYPNLVWEFYTNVVDKDLFSGNYVESFVWGTRLHLSREYIAHALGCSNTGPDVEYKKSFSVPTRWNMDDAGTRFGTQSEWAQEQNKKILFYAHKFPPVPHLILYLFGYNIIPTKSGRNDVRWSGLYFLDMMFHGSDDERATIPLPSIIISYMRAMARSTSKDICFGFPRLITLLLQRAQIDFTGEQVLELDDYDVVTTRFLRQIRMNDEAIATMEGRPLGGRQGAAGGDDDDVVGDEEDVEIPIDDTLTMPPPPP